MTRNQATLPFFLGRKLVFNKDLDSELGTLYSGLAVKDLDLDLGLRPK